MSVVAGLAVAAVAASCGIGDSTSSGAAIPTDADTLAIVVGGRANMVPPSVTAAVQRALDDASDDGDVATVIVADGMPNAEAPLPLATANDNDLYRADQRRQLNAAVTAAQAQEPEVDLLAALALAARATSANTGDRTIVVIDSGLQTAGALRFQDADGALLGADPKEVVDYLSAQRQLPDLHGTTVLLSGLGDTEAPQDALPQHMRAALVDLWRTVVTTAGGDVQVVETPLPLGKVRTGLPSVTPVPIQQVTAGPPPPVQVLTDGVVGFVPDQATFRDPIVAEQVLKPYVAALTSGRTLVITGTTASVGAEPGRIALSHDRANAVRDLLVRLGAPAASIQTNGVGTDFPEFVPDRDAQGNLVPANAAQNRRVVLELR